MRTCNPDPSEADPPGAATVFCLVWKSHRTFEICSLRCFSRCDALVVYECCHGCLGENRFWSLDSAKRNKPETKGRSRASVTVGSLTPTSSDTTVTSTPAEFWMMSTLPVSRPCPFCSGCWPSSHRLNRCNALPTIVMMLPESVAHNAQPLVAYERSTRFLFTFV